MSGSIAAMARLLLMLPLTLCALACGQSTPEGSPPPPPLPWDDTWSACEAELECTLVPTDCCGCGGRAVHRQHAERARASLAVEPCDCNEQDCSDWVAICERQRCVVLDPRALALRTAEHEGEPLPEEQICQTDADCALVEHTCRGHVAANRGALERVQQRVERALSAGIACARRGEVVPFETVPVCAEGRCGAVRRAPSDDRACRRERDCRATRIGGRWTAARVAWVEAYDIDRHAGGPAPGEADDARTAWCFERECRVRPNIEELAEGCTADADCVALRVICGHWEPFLRSNLSVAQARAREISSARGCGQPNTSPEPPVVCREARCQLAPVP